MLRNCARLSASVLSSASSSVSSSASISHSTATAQGVLVNKMIDIQREGLKLFKKKNADYGSAFATYGSVGVIVRIGDKITRLANITKSEVRMVNDETLRDTLIDLHNYSAMAIMLLDDPKLSGVGGNNISSKK